MLDKVGGSSVLFQDGCDFCKQRSPFTSRSTLVPGKRRCNLQLEWNSKKEKRESSGVTADRGKLCAVVGGEEQRGGEEEEEKNEEKISIAHVGRKKCGSYTK